VRKKRKLEQDSSEEKCSKQLCPEVPKLEWSNDHNNAHCQNKL
jgi:hypothetical protein